MSLWMTLDELEGDNIKHNYKGRDDEYLVKISNIGSHLDFTLTNFISYMITTIGATLLSHWRVRGILSFVQIVTLHVTLP